MAETTSKSRQKGGSSSKRGSSSGGSSGTRSASSRGGSSTNGASARSRTASSSRRTASSRASSGGARKSSGGARKSSGGRGSSSAKRSNANRGSDGLKGQVKNARNAASSGVQTAGHAVGTAASKAKGPAIAGGAALAGLVGGVTIARGGRRRVLGVPVPGTRRALIKVKRPMRANTTRDLVKAAGRMGNAGRQMAELASEMRLAREQMGRNGRRRSPVEVVLEGLTSRRPR
jgi:hypothetical protein